MSLYPAPKIGPWQLPNNLILAPMAGVTDRPFRLLCRRLGAGLAVSEMVSANPKLRDTEKSRLRGNHEGESLPRGVQIAGSEPQWMTEAAKYNVANGAQIIDINMGCPAKKVCNKAAGSALLGDEPLVEAILTAVTAAVDVPVTLKIRTGLTPDTRNGLTIARIAEQAGIAALSVHGRTRADQYQGQAEYDSIAAIKAAVSMPVFANGDIDSPQKAKYVLDYTKADGLLVGRAAQGNPWIFREIAHYLDTGLFLDAPTTAEIHQTVAWHLNELHQFYGEYRGVRIARKHLGWYLGGLPGSQEWLPQLKRSESVAEQFELVEAIMTNGSTTTEVDFALAA